MCLGPIAGPHMELPATPTATATVTPLAAVMTGDEPGLPATSTVLLVLHGVVVIQLDSHLFLVIKKVDENGQYDTQSLTL